MIFDQFEELQSYTPKQITFFKIKIAELFNTQVPLDIYSEIEIGSSQDLSEVKESDEKRNVYSENIAFLEQPLHVRALFVVREDKLGAMSLLSDYFPDILKNDFILSPLDNVNARKAISDPAGKANKDGNFISSEFQFTDDAITYLLENFAEPNTGNIDPMQVQIVCSSIEKTIAKKKSTITKNDLPPIGDILNDFYRDIWNEIKFDLRSEGKEFDKWRKVIIEELIINEKRNLVHKDNLIKTKIDEAIINRLVKRGLLREIASGNQTFYQLCHDRLIKPLMDDLRQLKANEEAEKKLNDDYVKTISLAKERRFKTLTGSSILLGFFLCLSIYFAWQAKKAQHRSEQDRIISIAKSIINSNPTLSYEVVNEWKKKGIYDCDLDSFLLGYDSLKYAYLLGTYPLLSGIMSADISPDNQNLVVNEPMGQTTWDISKGVLLRKQQRNKNGTAVKFFTINNEHYYAVSQNDSLEIKDESDKTIRKFPGSSDENNIVVSNDGSYILIEDKLYNFKTGDYIDIIPR
ncbi:MAG TPA: hypothetical protein VFJ43_02515, partial [Bacteroidia bacterium]|nr:hypothetical protein [Bacteroidia bacterium]